MEIPGHALLISRGFRFAPAIRYTSNFFRLRQNRNLELFDLSLKLFRVAFFLRPRIDKKLLE